MPRGWRKVRVCVDGAALGWSPLASGLLELLPNWSDRRRERETRVRVWRRGPVRGFPSGQRMREECSGGQGSKLGAGTATQGPGVVSGCVCG